VTLSEIFGRTPEEDARLAASPFAIADEKIWESFAGIAVQGLLKCYASGEIDLREVLRITNCCSLGCSPQNRAKVLAAASRLALDITPKRPKPGSKKLNTWVKESAVELCKMFEVADPRTREGSKKGADGSSTSRAIDQLKTLGIITSVAPISLYDSLRKNSRKNSLKKS
jgi:hypothetical protein